MEPLPRLRSLATAAPSHVIDQDQVREWAHRFFDGGVAEIERLLPAFDHAGVASRRSCVPLEWYGREHGWAEKNRLYVRHALDLLEACARRCLAEAGVGAEAVDAVVAVSSTGIATPSLDALLAQRLGLRAEMTRLPLFGLGCAGGVLGLARAAELARARPGRMVLFCVVELCGLTFRQADRSKSNVIATALFGDGAAAALIDCGDRGPALTAWGEHTWPDTLDVMGWRVEDDGLGVVFSRDIPALVRHQLRAAADAFLARHGLAVADLDGFACHPGGAKVLAALEDAFGLPEGAMGAARDVLREFGNMSAATVLFVLRRLIDAGAGGRWLASALGPGFTAGFLVLETR